MLRRSPRESRNKDEGYGVEEDGCGDELGVALAEVFEEELGGDGGEGCVGEPNEFIAAPAVA
jgi:hypothetical protein